MKKGIKLVVFLGCILQGLFSFAQQTPNHLPLYRTCGTETPDAAWETWFSSKVQKFKNDRLAGRPAVVNYTIPVIVHVLHSGTAVGVNENISLAQIQSQITILNKDYSGTNTDLSSVPAEFLAAKSGNTGIQFCLAKQDPNGVALAEYGVDRINWQSKGWSDPNLYPGTNSAQALRTFFSDTVKPATIWDPTRYLNIWVAQIDNSGMLGWSTFPIGTGMSDITASLETATTSGVVINEKAWGNIGTAAFGNYNLGRTATHEIGHWLGVYHTFQNGCVGTTASTCSNSGDYCCDTPPESTSDFGCPSTKNTCTETPTDLDDMTMNFMNYVNDACMFMFTTDQATRMQTAMANGTYRLPLKNSTACIELNPDLSIVSNQITPISVTTGNTVTANFIEKNNAVGNSNPNYVNFYLSTDNVLTPGLNGDTLLDQYFVSQVILANSQTALFAKQLTIPSNLATGTYYIFFVADGTGIITESNESNNNASVAISVDFACSPASLPSIAVSSGAAGVCYNSSSQTTTLTYGSVTNAPISYSISWNVIPSNNFVGITNAALPASPINISVPAGTAAGTYTGTIYVKNANGCVSVGNSFTVTVNSVPAISLAPSALSKCYSAGAQTTTLSYSTVTGSPTTYSISWISGPANSFLAVTNAALTSSPLTINIPAGTSPGTYTGTLTVKNAGGCISMGYNFSVVINSWPSITSSVSAAGVCSNVNAQTTTLSYSAVTETPTLYNISWSSSPVNNFVNVTNATLPSSPITINVPANAAAGTYFGTIYVSNANGCISNGRDFSLVITNSQSTTITSESNAVPVCFNIAAQSSSLSYSAVTGSPVSYSMTWSTTPSNNFVPVIDSILPASPIGIAIPANTTAGNYTGTLKVKNSIGCNSSGNIFTLTVNPIPTITLSASAVGKCFSANAQTTTLAYSAVTGAPLTYSIVWNSSPANSFATVTDAALSSSPLTINIPAGTLPGTYTGTVSVKNAGGCISTGYNFSVTVNPLPTITSATGTAGICSSVSAQTTTLSYSAVTGTPTTYSIIWSSIPANSFVNVTNAVLPVSPITINVPANATPGIYTGTISVNNAGGCVSAGNDFTLEVTNSLATSITTAANAGPVCLGSGVQSTSLMYSSVSGSPITYSMTWSTSPANSFAAVIDSALPASPIGIVVPANAAAGTYTGTVKVKNSLGCSSSGNSFVLTVNPLPTITLAATAAAKCFSTNAQTTTITYSAVTNSPTTYSIVWNATPANNFVQVDDAAITASPLSLNIPAGTLPGTYTGTLTVKNANGCISAAKIFTLIINPLPSITTAATATGICSGSTAQVTTLAYSAVTGTPTTYSIVWSSTPANSFVAVNNAALQANQINITVPANTAAGIYTGTLTVKNANGCVSNGSTFTVAVSNNQSTNITIASSAAGVCFNANAQTSSLSYSAVSGSPITYSMTWNTTPANSFVPVTDSVLPLSPIGIAVPANTLPGTYTGSIRVKNAVGCIGSVNNFTLKVDTIPTIATSSSASNKCFSTIAQTTTLLYSSKTGSPVTYSIDWNITPANSFAAVTDAVLTTSPITINIPAGTNPGTYTGNIKVKNAGGCTSISKAFTIKIYPLPTISIASAANGVCFNSSAQNTPLTYSAVTSSPTYYSITWNDNPVNNFVPVSNGTLISSPITIAVPANTLPGTYTGNLTVKNLNLCVSNVNTFVVAVSSPSSVSDTTLQILCADQLLDISNLFAVSGFTKQWSLSDPTKAPPGIHKLYITNNAGCNDSSNITIKMDIEQWSGNVSTNWHDPANWSNNKVPGDSTHVWLVGPKANSCTINTGNASAASVQIFNGATININNNQKLSIKAICDSLPVPVFSLPVITTSTATGITQSAAVSGGNISSDGGTIVTARGICYSTFPNPTVAENIISSGSGTGNFISNISALIPNTTYYIRAYATNSDGTVYGDQVNFTTLP